MLVMLIANLAIAELRVQHWVHTLPNVLQQQAVPVCHCMLNCIKVAGEIGGRKRKEEEVCRRRKWKKWGMEVGGSCVLVHSLQNSLLRSLLCSWRRAEVSTKLCRITDCSGPYTFYQMHRGHVAGRYVTRSKLLITVYTC